MDPDGSHVTPVTRNAVDDRQAEWRPTPSVVRTLIGPSASDGGSRPPFGSQRPLVILGLTVDGLASETTIELAQRNGSTLQVEALPNIGTDLTGLKVPGPNIRQVIEDMGRGKPARVWTVASTRTSAAVLIFVSGQTGRVASVLAVDEASAGVRAHQMGDRIALYGAFTEVYSSHDPQRNLARAVTPEVTVDVRTGEVVSVGREGRR